jgi:hypothetical protein
MARITPRTTVFLPYSTVTVLELPVRGSGENTCCSHLILEVRISRFRRGKLTPQGHSAINPVEVGWMYGVMTKTLRLAWWALSLE